MVIVTTEDGLKKALNNKERAIFIKGELSEILTLCLSDKNMGLEGLISSGLFNISKDTLNFYKCSADVNALMQFLESYYIIESDPIKKSLLICNNN